MTRVMGGGGWVTGRQLTLAPLIFNEIVCLSSFVYILKCLTSLHFLASL